jgi:hypothetical protein
MSTMRSLDTHDELEQLLGRQARPEGVNPPLVSVIYFTARWCGACKRLDLPALEAAFPTLDWLKCDVNINTYSPGFCGVRSIPSFMLIVKKTPIGPFTSSDTAKVGAWVQAQLEGAGLLGAA